VRKEIVDVGGRVEIVSVAIRGGRRAVLGRRDHQRAGVAGDGAWRDLQRLRALMKGERETER
jgi:hypothetical protein